MTYMLSVIAIMIVGFLYLYFTHRSERRDQMKHELDMRKAAGDAIIAALSGVERSREGEVIELMQRVFGKEESKEGSGNPLAVSAEQLEDARLARYDAVREMASDVALQGHPISGDVLVRMLAEANKPTEGVLQRQAPVSEPRTGVRAKVDDNDGSGSHDLDAAPREAPEKSKVARSG